MDFPKLRTELTTDPLALGYAGMSDSAAAEAMNLVRDGSAGKTPATKRGRQNVPTLEVLEAILISDLQPDTNANNTRLTAAWFESITQNATLRLFENDGVTQTRTKANLDSIVRNTGGSQTRLNAIASEFVSRSTLLGLGEVTPGDVNIARSGNF